MSRRLCFAPAALGLAAALLLAPLAATAQDEMLDPTVDPEDAPIPEAKPDPPARDDPDRPALPQVDGAVLQGLDKITARISTFVAPIGEPVRFGSLEIVARVCHKTPPEEPPERTAFLEIVDVRPDGPPVHLFNGWMFASSPAISALEHPVYDVWVTDCMKASSSASETSSGN